MKKLLTIFFILTCEICRAQNLVPNGNFEQYYGCPNAPSQIDSAFFWMNTATGAMGGTPDYFNQCAPFYYAGVPQNSLGFQPAHGGNAYSGIFLWGYYSEAREYIAVALTSTLTFNSCYHFEMYVNLGDSSRYTTDDIGVYFSDTLIAGITNAYSLPFTPQISNTNYLDTLNWVLVTGDYIAHGGESYLIIGNFKNDSSTTVMYADSSAPFLIVYAYIDDVSLTPCQTGISEQNESFDFILSNSITDKLEIKSSNNLQSEIILYDIASRKIIQQKFTNFISINTEQLSKGIYLYEVRCGSSLCKKGKVVKD